MMSYLHDFKNTHTSEKLKLGKKFLIGLIFLNFATAQATDKVNSAKGGREGALGQVLRVNETITVESGKVSETGILADSNGTVFLEFLKGSFINYSIDGQPFSGEILAPSIIDLTEKLPRGRMREILTFELLTDNADEVNLVDRYTLMHPKEYLRTTIANPDGLIHNGGIKLLTRIYDKDKIGFPTLWRLETKKSENTTQEINYWKRVGGKLNESPESDVQIFSAIISRTGVYGLFDENPKPFYSENTPLETVEKVAESPFPSVVPQPPQPELLMEEEITPFDESGNDDFSLKNDTLVIPAVKESENSNTLIIPAIKTNDEISPIEEKELSSETSEKEKESENNTENQMHTSVLDVNDIRMLPVAGEKNVSSRFPIILILSFFLIGFSIYLAVKKEYS